MGVESWIMMAGGAFLLNLCFASFIAPTPGCHANRSRFLKHLLECAELYESRGEITDNENGSRSWSPGNDCAVALSTKYSPTGTR
jgi:hypothetical protein